jgi:hypothetical protein
MFSWKSDKGRGTLCWMLCNPSGKTEIGRRGLVITLTQEGEKGLQSDFRETNTSTEVRRAWRSRGERSQCPESGGLWVFNDLIGQIKSQVDKGP